MSAVAMIVGMANLYPCTHCRDHFIAYVHDHPPAAESRQTLVKWVCGLHNEVNERLGKPLHSCDAEALEVRWRKGRPACWAAAAGGWSNSSARTHLDLVLLEDGSVAGLLEEDHDCGREAKRVAGSRR